MADWPWSAHAEVIYKAVNGADSSQAAIPLAQIGDSGLQNNTEQMQKKCAKNEMSPKLCASVKSKPEIKALWNHSWPCQLFSSLCLLNFVVFLCSLQFYSFFILICAVSQPVLHAKSFTNSVCARLSTSKTKQISFKLTFVSLSFFEYKHIKNIMTKQNIFLQYCTLKMFSGSLKK